MNYANVIPFDRKQAAAEMSTRTVPMIGLVQIQAAPSLRYEEAACDSDVLFEQLEYLIQFADREPDRYNRVRAILLERFV